MAARKSYEDWLRDVDQDVQKLCGVSCDDLPDWRYADAYADGRSARQAARSVVAAAKKDMGY